MTWDRGGLRDALHGYDTWLQSRDLSANTVHSHGYYAGLFVRWLYAEYSPRGRYARRDPVHATRALSSADLDAELKGYEGYLAENGLIPGAVNTYVRGAALFVKWLTTPERTAARSQPRPAPAGPPREPPRPPTAIAVPEPNPQPNTGWPSEAAVQSMVVGWLVREGWSIVRVAQTSSREHGVDIVARRDGIETLVEVKGYPTETYAAGERAGQARAYNPATQARTYFGNALLAVLAMHDDAPDAEVVLAVPDVVTYRGLIEKVRGSLTHLRVRVLLVTRDGDVREGLALGG